MAQIQGKYQYHDYSGEPEGDPLLYRLMKANDSPSNSKGGDNSFPVKLHYALGEIEKDGLSHIVSWQPHGRCVVVHNQAEFVKRVLPCWFRQSKFTSFQRQLNLYGFRRLTTGRDKGGYYHELFLRGKPDLAAQIERRKIKGTGTRKPSSPETEPNFYGMKYLPESRPSVALGNDLVAPLNVRTIFSQALARSYDSHLPPSVNHLDAMVLATCESHAPTKLQESSSTTTLGRMGVENKSNILGLYNEILSQLPFNEGSSSVMAMLPTSI